VIYEIQKLSTDLVSPQIILSGIGTISESDVRRAEGKSKAIIIGFNVSVDRPALHLAERNEIEIKTFDIIYKMTKWLSETLITRTPKVEVKESLGIAKIIKIFSKVKDKQIVGGKVEHGAIALGSTVKIIRREAEIGEGKVKELQEQKNKTDTVAEGKEFGALIECKIEIAAGDRIESFIITTK